MNSSILTKIICDTYENVFRRKTKKAMKVTFTLSIDYAKEEGYRSLELLIMWEGYVGVFCRETFSVIPKDGIDYENDCLKQGYEYNEGTTEWQCLSCHDSCWRSDGIGSFIFKNQDRINHLHSIMNWYEEVEISEVEDRMFRMIESSRR